MKIQIITDAISKHNIEHIAKDQFGDMVKAVVDVEKAIMAIGGELHADEEAVLLENGSLQENLWGINLYPEKSAGEWIEFNSMINVRPSRGNRSRMIESQDMQEKIRAIIKKLIPA
ncbi:MAG: DUF5674 family protein [Candidatus Sungiibacteriota bacterium]